MAYSSPRKCLKSFFGDCAVKLFSRYLPNIRLSWHLFPSPTHFLLSIVFFSVVLCTYPDLCFSLFPSLFFFSEAQDVFLYCIKSLCAVFLASFWAILLKSRQNCVGSTFLREEDPFLGSCRNKYIPDFLISLFFITLSHSHTLWYGSCYVQEVHLFLHVWALSKTNSFRFLGMSGYWATCLFLMPNRLANNNFKETMIPLAQKSFIYMHNSA